jgi:hypothetical protein
MEIPELPGQDCHPFAMFLFVLSSLFTSYFACLPPIFLDSTLALDGEARFFAVRQCGSQKIGTRMRRNSGHDELAASSLALKSCQLQRPTMM